MEKSKKLPEPMFKFSTKLFVFRNRIKKNGLNSLYLQIYISIARKQERSYLSLNFEWPMDRVDFDNAMLLPRSREDVDVNDYNMIIMTERAKYNEIAKIYRLSNRILTSKDLKREVVFSDAKKSVVAYCERTVIANEVKQSHHSEANRPLGTLKKNKQESLIYWRLLRRSSSQ